jgi:hypothetical protein
VAGFQFLHIDTFGFASPKKAARRRWTMREVFAEAAREPEPCPHVAALRPPVLIHGQPLAEVERALTEAAEAARDGIGRRREARCDYPGRRAVAEAKAAGVVSKSELDRRYQAAMRTFQDDYLAAIGARHGLTRRGRGPGRRLTRAQWHEEHNSAERLSDVLHRGAVAVERSAALEHETMMLAIAAADEGVGRRLAKHERDRWSKTAQQFSAELAAERAAGRRRKKRRSKKSSAPTGSNGSSPKRARRLPWRSPRRKRCCEPCSIRRRRCSRIVRPGFDADLWTAIRQRVSGGLAERARASAR